MSGRGEREEVEGVGRSFVALGDEEGMGKGGGYDDGVFFVIEVMIPNAKTNEIVLTEASSDAR